MPAPPSAAHARYVPLVEPAAKRHGEDEEEECCYAARARYVPLRRRREGEEYAARRALFLQSYRFTTAALSAAGERDGGLRGKLARRVRDAVSRAASRARAAARWWVGAGVARAWPRVGWWWWRPPRARLGCFGGHGHGRKLSYLHDFA